MSSRLTSFGTIGALAGLSWWVIHDLFLCPHGRTSSIEREILSYSIQGGLLFGALYHPAAFGYGMIAGAVTGNLNCNDRFDGWFVESGEVT